MFGRILRLSTVTLVSTVFDKKLLDGNAGF